jgi:hypothetical protein
MDIIRLQLGDIRGSNTWRQDQSRSISLDVKGLTMSLDLVNIDDTTLRMISSNDERTVNAALTSTSSPQAEAVIVIADKEPLRMLKLRNTRSRS